MNMLSACFVVAAIVQIAPGCADASGLLASPAVAQKIDNTQLADTVRALDTNGNGKVDKSELTGFAKSQGLSAEEVLADFKELDVNNDGALDSSEIGPLFGATADAAEALVSNPQVVAKPAGSLEKEASNIPAVVATPALSNTNEKVKVMDTNDKTPLQAKDTTMGLDLDALERDAQKQAGAVLANRLAQRAQILAARSNADEKKAESFDVQVRTLRGNATAVAQSANKETREAASTASSAVSEKSMIELRKLQEDEHEAVEGAKLRRQEAKKAMERVRKAQDSLRIS